MVGVRRTVAGCRCRLRNSGCGSSSSWNLGRRPTTTRGVRLSGVLDVEALERSFTEIVRRHEALRTRFETS
jgi:hypothetical protein